MDTILETDAVLDVIRDAETVRQAYDGIPEQPRPEWVRGVCPLCGGPVVSNCYYVGGRGFLIVWECWNSLDADPSCTHRRIL